DSPAYRYAINTETSPNFMSSFGCVYDKGLSDGVVYNGWKPKNAADIFGGAPLQITGGLLTTYRTSMPNTGTYFQGDYVCRTNPIKQGYAGNQYIIKGWLRLTTGSGHVLNTDWAEDRALTGT